MEKTTFTLQEASELLSCHIETLRRAVRDGELRAAKLGKGYRVSKKDLEEFWTAKGGGALFEDSPLPPRRPRIRRRKKPQGPDQLSLFSDEEEGHGTR